jgi:alkanesulfonate monooxygenase SsuD/methylene tetrahydromethanopterin reductase-like flavin-dependent oxidoreductase (luciferase family)
MRIGVFLLAARFPGQSDDEVLAATVQAAVAAERAGFDDVWLAEHHFMCYGICPSAVTLAGYLLGRTQRVAVGTAVSVLSSWHPVALAEQAALLDQVSAGRFRLGVGRGGPWLELEVFGTGLDRYERGFAESLDLLLAALSRDRVGAAGEFFRFREVPVVPRPRTRPHPPVVVAATTPATAEFAAARGLPVLLGHAPGRSATLSPRNPKEQAHQPEAPTLARRPGTRAGLRDRRPAPAQDTRRRLQRRHQPLVDAAAIRIRRPRRELLEHGEQPHLHVGGWYAGIAGHDLGTEVADTAGDEGDLAFLGTLADEDRCPIPVLAVALPA